MHTIAAYALGESAKFTRKEKLEALTTGFVFQARAIWSDPTERHYQRTEEQLMVMLGANLRDLVEWFAMGEAGTLGHAAHETQRGASLYDAIAAELNRSDRTGWPVRLPTSYENLDELRRSAHRPPARQSARSLSPDS